MQEEVLHSSRRVILMPSCEGSVDMHKHGQQSPNLWRGCRGGCALSIVGKAGAQPCQPFKVDMPSIFCCFHGRITSPEPCDDAGAGTDMGAGSDMGAGAIRLGFLRYSRANFAVACSALRLLAPRASKVCS